MKRFLPLLFLGSCTFFRPDPGPAGVLPDPQEAENQKFRGIVEAFLAWHASAHPHRATSLGIHDHDARLGDWSRAGIEARITSLQYYLKLLSRINAPALYEEDGYDFAVLESHVRAELLRLETLRPWERNPNFYRDIIAGGLYSISSLSFDTPARRMALAAERLKQVASVLAAARENLADPPRVFTETAIEEFTGTRNFIKKGLPAAFEAVKDPEVRKHFEEARQPALAAIESFIDWMRKDLLPRSNGAFALGEENYRAKLLYEEMVDTPIDDLLKRGYELLKATQEQMKKLVGERSVRAVLKETSKDHPAADRLLDETRGMLEDLKKWAAGVVDIPDDASVRVQETPEFRRALTFASMEIPGPFETVAREAYYNVTPPDPSWPPEKQEQHLSFFNRHSLPLISVHEAYPGHYAQFLAVRGCASKVRRAFGCRSFSEGWAHYCEQLYAEREGASTELRLHQLSMALLRICRYLMGIEMHARGRTLEEAVEFFVREGYLERANAEREALRGTSDPTYLVYTLGKMEILKLRDEYLAVRGASLREFHNEFIRHGYPPIPILRTILLGRGR